MNILVDSFGRQEWKQYSKIFKDNSIYQAWEYQEVRAERAGQQISRIMIMNDTQKPILMAQMRIQRVPTVGLKIGYVQSGPLIQNQELDVSALSEALAALKQLYFKKKVDVLRIIPNIVKDQVGEKIENCLLSAGFVRAANHKPYQTIMVSLIESADDIMSRIDRESRRNIRKAEKANIELQEGNSLELFAILEDMYSKAKDRKGFLGINSDEFAEVQKRMDGDDKARILVSYQDNEAISAHATTHFGNTAIPIITANTIKGLQSGSSYLIWWKAYLSAKESGLMFYDLGGIDEKENPKGYLFKKRMGGQEVFHIGAFDACVSRWAGLQWWCAEKAYNYLKWRQRNKSRQVC